MKKACDHFLALKPEKVANFIKKTQVKCSFKNHVALQYNLCLNCGETRCDTSQEYFCSKQHSQTNKHYVVLKIMALQIYCFHCEKYIDELVVDADGSKNEKKKIEKMMELQDKIITLTEKYLATHKLEKKKKQSRKKIEQYPTNQEPMQIKQSHKIKKQLPLRVFGLTNIGNTCYFNSVLQCLYATQEVHELYHEVQFKDDMNLVFKKFLRNTEKVYCPKNLFSLMSKTHKFLKGMDQQDAFQLYVLLLNSLIEGSQRKNQSKSNPNISSIFGFHLASRLECLQCGKVSWNKDFSLGLNVPVAKKSSKKIDHVPSNEPIPANEIGQQGLSIPAFQPTNTFLDNFFDPELFTKSNSFKCQQCEESNAVHKFYIKQAPSILTINFKRFNNSGTKLNSKVLIPKQISLQNFLLKKGSYRYELYAGVVHSGSSSGGHYVAYTKRSDQWIYFSDSHYKPGGSFKTTQPYVVFYRRIECEEQKPIWAKTLGKQKEQQKQKLAKKQENNLSSGSKSSRHSSEEK